MKAKITISHDPRNQAAAEAFGFLCDAYRRLFARQGWAFHLDRVSPGLYGLEDPDPSFLEHERGVHRFVFVPKSDFRGLRWQVSIQVGGGLDLQREYRIPKGGSPDKVLDAAVLRDWGTEVPS